MNVAEFQRIMAQIREAHITAPPIHAVIVTWYWIPNGHTHMYRSDGRIVIYVWRPVWDLLPKQEYAGCTLLEVSYERFAAFPVHIEELPAEWKR